MPRTAKLAVNLVIAAVIAYFLGNLAYMNLRDADPILPGWEEYDATRFTDRLATGEPLLVEIYASWCPTCKAQHEAFEALTASGQAVPIRAVRVDYDRDAAFREARNIESTGLLLLFKDGQEVSRVAGLTTPDALLSYLESNGFGPKSL